MNRAEAIQSILNRHEDAFFIFSNGLTSREAAYYCKRSGSLYMLHAMGEALSVGMGLASARPDLQIVVIDGDGNALMGSSSWVMNDFDNLEYYVLANRMFATTGGQALPEKVKWPEWSRIVPIKNKPSEPTPPPPSPEDIWKGLNPWIKKRTGK